MHDIQPDNLRNTLDAQYVSCQTAEDRLTYLKEIRTQANDSQTDKADAKIMHAFLLDHTHAVNITRDRVSDSSMQPVLERLVELENVNDFRAGKATPEAKTASAKELVEYRMGADKLVIALLLGDREDNSPIEADNLAAVVYFKLSEVAEKSIGTGGQVKPEAFPDSIDAIKDTPAQDSIDNPALGTPYGVSAILKGENAVRKAGDKVIALTVMQLHGQADCVEGLDAIEGYRTTATLSPAPNLRQIIEQRLNEVDDNLFTREEQENLKAIAGKDSATDAFRAITKSRENYQSLPEEQQVFMRQLLQDIAADVLLSVNRHNPIEIEGKPSYPQVVNFHRTGGFKGGSVLSRIFSPESNKSKRGWKESDGMMVSHNYRAAEHAKERHKEYVEDGISRVANKIIQRRDERAMQLALEQLERIEDIGGNENPENRHLLNSREHNIHPPRPLVSIHDTTLEGSPLSSKTRILT